MKAWLPRLAPLMMITLLAGCSESGVHAGGMPKDIPAEAPKPPADSKKILELSKVKNHSGGMSAAMKRRLQLGPSRR